MYLYALYLHVQLHAMLSEECVLFGIGDNLSNPVNDRRPVCVAYDLHIWCML